jgi:glucose-1-phosphate thymidylyltransferase
MSARKGIIVAAGKATRLHPATLAFGKMFLPVYDKPMIYYPLTALLLARIRDILIVTSPRDLPLMSALLGDGKQWGVSIAYAEQKEARGIADAFLQGADFLGNAPSCMILGDNFFSGPGFDPALRQARAATSGASVFCIEVADPRAYGVAYFGPDGGVEKLIEKPQDDVSKWAATGLYFYDDTAVARAKTLKPSARGELEVTDLNISYLNDGALNAVRLDPSTHWYDLGTHSSMLDAAYLVRAEERKAGAKIGCPDDAAFRMGFIDREQLLRNASALGNKDYADYLRALK